MEQSPEMYLVWRSKYCSMIFHNDDSVVTHFHDVHDVDSSEARESVMIKL